MFVSFVPAATIAAFCEGTAPKEARRIACDRNKEKECTALAATTPTRGARPKHEGLWRYETAEGDVNRPLDWLDEANRKAKRSRAAPGKSPEACLPLRIAACAKLAAPCGPTGPRAMTGGHTPGDPCFISRLGGALAPCRTAR